MSKHKIEPIEVRCPECHHLQFKALIFLPLPTVLIETVCWKCRAKVIWPDPENMAKAGLAH